MSNPGGVRALHAYRAQADRRWLETLRRFGYHASADMVERRAARHERAAGITKQEAPQDQTCGASDPSHSEPV